MVLLYRPSNKNLKTEKSRLFYSMSLKISHNCKHREKNIYILSLVNSMYNKSPFT